MSGLLDTLYAERERRQAEEDTERLSQSLVSFVREAFPVIKPTREYRHNWHIDAICEHLEAVSSGDIKRLQVWIPPGTMKSMNVSIFWPVWEWTRDPGLRYWCASHSLGLVWDHSSAARTLLLSNWFRNRWGHLFQMTKVGERSYANDQGGTRSGTTPESEGFGKHGDRIILDDLLDAADAESTTRVVLDKTNDWYDTVIGGRKETDAAEVIIMQRLHENDIAAHALEVGEWTVLCLPERCEKNHPFAWRGDPRSEGELLWPAHRDEQESSEYARRLTSFRAAGQLQQRPAALEVEIMKREWWRFYDKRIKAKEEWTKLPAFTTVVISVDTPLKDKESNDNVAIQCYGVRGADRYLVDLRLGKMNFSSTKRQIKEMSQWARKTWRSASHYCLIENAGFGPELIIDLKREITGVIKIDAGAEGNKVQRAISACDALESGNVYLPGHGPPWQPALNEALCEGDIADFIANLALFPNGRHDDDVDAWSQAMNWLRSRTWEPIRTSNPFKRLAGRR